MNRFRFLPSYHFADSTDGVIQNPAELTLRNYTIAGSEGGVGDCAEKRSDLPSGYEQLSYIESTGTQYIDTGIDFKNVYGYEVRYQSTGKVKSNANYDLDGIFGINAIGADTKIWFVYSNDKPGLSIFLRGSSSVSKYYTSYDEYYAAVHHVKVETNGTVWYNGENIGTISGFTTTAKSGTLYLFCACDNAGLKPYYYSKTRMYHVKFYGESQALLGDFVPCKRISDGVLGMYDAVSGTFFTNKGTGTFLSAPLTYTIPILNNGTKAAEIVRSAPLYAGESISYRGDGLPAVSLSSGSNALTIGTAVQPGSVTYRYATYQH